MKILNNKGMTLITLAVTLAVIILITSTVVVSGLYSLESAKKTSFGIEIKNIQEVVDEYMLKTEDSVPIIKAITLSTIGLSENIKNEQFASETILSNTIILNVIDLKKLGIKNTKYGIGETELDYYAISPITNKVYYPSGIKAGGDVFYTLTNNLNKAIGKNEVGATTTKSVLFIPNLTSNKWMNNAVTVIVKVPEEFAVSSITATESVLISTVAISDGYKVYNVNTSNLIKTYSITVLYTVPGNAATKTALYNIDKVDSVAPSIAAPTQVYNIDSATNIASAYITGIDVTDASSLVKTIKYIKGTVTSSVDLKVFFTEYGIELEDNKIEIEKGATSYTIYAEDNAGNYTVINVAITAYIQSIL